MTYTGFPAFLRKDVLVCSFSGKAIAEDAQGAYKGISDVITSAVGPNRLSASMPGSRSYDRDDIRKERTMLKKDVIDSQFMESMADKKPFLKKMFAVFVSQEPQRVQQIKDALDSEDVDQLRHLAHSLKGGAATMGAERVRECCLLLENATKANDMSAARTHLRSLETEMDNAYTFMFNFMADN